MLSSHLRSSTPLPSPNRSPSPISSFGIPPLAALSAHTIHFNGSLALPLLPPQIIADPSAPRPATRLCHWLHLNLQHPYSPRFASAHLGGHSPRTLPQMSFFQSMSSMFGRGAQPRPNQEGFALPTTQFEHASALNPGSGTVSSTTTARPSAIIQTLTRSRNT